MGHGSGGHNRPNSYTCIVSTARARYAHSRTLTKGHYKLKEILNINSNTHARETRARDIDLNLTIPES